jgi:small subunit ribosomal protein S16
MNLAIRLQNHGKKNHPLWWIVVAPRKRNIRGRFIEHVGYWSPRTGVNLQRQVILNMPRVKYWMSCGAVPTYRIHRFLAMWGVLPKPWYYKSKNIFI